MKNLKTTIFGTLAAAGEFLASNTTGTVQQVSHLISVLSILLLGVHSKDSSTK